MDNSPSLPDQSASEPQRLCLLWQRRAIMAFVLARITTALAIGLGVGGVAWYFADFNFGSGGDQRGITLIVIALGCGVVAAVSNLVSLVAGWCTWRHAGTVWWFRLAILLPAIELLVLACVWSAL